MKTLGYYSIKNELIRKLLEDVLMYITSSFPDTLAINIIGSSVNEIVMYSEIPNSDIDIAILIESTIDYSKTNIDLEGINEFLMNKSVRSNLSYNGIRRISKENTNLSIDLILQSLEELTNKEPHIIFDVAKRNRILIYGEDYYKNLENIKMSYELLYERIKMTRNYINREIKKNYHTVNWVKYIAKSAILNTSYLFIDYYNTLNKKEIYKYGKKFYPKISNDIEYLYNIYLGKIKVDLEQIIKFNYDYGNKLLNIYKSASTKVQ